MINLIQGLIDKGFAYVSKNGVYFSVLKFKEYGKLSKKKIEELIAGARVEVDETKNDPVDFALWKFADDRSDMGIVRGEKEDLVGTLNVLQ